MKITTLFSLAVASTAAMASAKSIDPVGTQASNDDAILQALTHEDIIAGKQWWANQELQASTNTPGVNHYDINCLGQETVDASDFANAKRLLKDWCDAGNKLPGLSALAKTSGNVRVGMCSNGGEQPCSGDEIERILGEIASYCTKPAKSSEAHAGTWYEKDWRKTYFIKDCSKDTSVCNFVDTPCHQRPS